MADCIGKVLEQFPEADRKDVETLFERMSRAKKAGFLQGAGSDVDFMKKSQEMLQRYRRVVDVTKARALRDEITRSRRIEFANNPGFTGSVRRGISSFAEGYQAWMTGTHKNIPGARMSVDVISSEVRDAQFSHFLGKLSDTPGAEGVLRSGTKDVEIGRARWLLANGKELPRDVDPIVASIAKAWQELGDLQLQTSNDAGAFVTKRDGHMFIRSYDPGKIEANPDGFKEWMLNNVDYKKSFEREFHTVDPVKAVDDLTQRIIDRTQGVAESGDPLDGVKVVNAPSNLDKIMGRGRTFEFLTPEAEIEFMQKWSRHTSVADTIEHSVTENARRAALIQKFGSNPREQFLRDTAKLSAADKAMLERHWNVISGVADIPGDDPVSKWGASIRKTTDITSLGYSTLRNFPDLGTTSATLRVGGKNFIERQFEMISEFMKGIPKENRTAAMKLYGIGADSMRGEYFNRVGTTSGGHAWISKAHKQFFDLIGQRLWTSASEVGMAQTLAAGLGDSAGLTFAKLNEHSAKILQKYGIGPVEWDIIRASAQASEDGITFIGSNGVRALPDDVVKKIMDSGGVVGFDPGLYKRISAQKLGSYFRDRVDIGMNRAGAFEKASLLNRGWMEGTAEGQAIRFLSHFKSYSYTMASKFSKAYYYENLAGKSLGEGAATLAPVMVSLTALGYTGQVAWDLAHNRTPSDPTRPKTMVDAMVRGGMGGIYGDFLLGTWDSRHGRDALSFLAGPEAGKVKDMMDLVSDFKEAGLERDASKIRASAITRFLKNNLVGNIPVVSQGMDYLWFNALAEAQNHGYNERMKARLEKQGQSRLVGD